MDLRDELPVADAVPECLLACAQFVPVDGSQDDVPIADGPASSTTAAAQEASVAEDGDDVSPGWPSVIDDDTSEVVELSKLPALQSALQKAETQAGKVLANELSALASGASAEILDEAGRAQLLELCEDVVAKCSRVSEREERLKVQWRLQALLTNQPEAAHEEAHADVKNDDEDAGSNVEAGASATARPARPARLRVPTSRQPLSWWDPRYWPSARPTDWCYGDCVWGLEF